MGAPRKAAASPLGAKSTAQEALQGADLSGKTAIVTGGNSGIGVETARALARAGARVILTSRSVPAGQAVADGIKAGGAKGEVVVKQLDLSDLTSVHNFAKDVVATEPRLDLLILNAGIMAVPLSYTSAGFESQIGTNHFGHFALTTALLDKMKAQGTLARVVVVSALLHETGKIDLNDLHYRRHPYHAFKSYGQSKLANILFANELARRLEGSNVSAFSLHPGVIHTNLANSVKWPLRMVFRAFGSWIYPMKTVPQGAATTIYAAVSPELEGRSGAYLQDCALRTPSADAQDMELAQKLWKVTEEQLAAAREAAGL